MEEVGGEMQRDKKKHNLNKNHKSQKTSEAFTQNP